MIREVTNHTVRKWAAVALAGLVSATCMLLTFRESQAQETRRGAGLGALLGQAIGGDTESTLIGAAIGGGVGHVIGDKKDEQKAAQMAAQSPTQPATHDEVGPFRDTLWQLTSLNPKKIAAEYVSKALLFRSDGILLTLTTQPGGNITLAQETYRVVDSTLIVNKPGYLINARFRIDGDQATISAQEFSAVLTRLRPE